MAVSILLVRGLVDAIENVGIDRTRLFEAAAFDAARIDDGEGRLALEEYDALVECALDLTGDPALGLHVAATANATTHNLTAHLVAHAPTLRDGIDALVRFQRLMSDRPAWRFEEGQRTATLFYGRFPDGALLLRRTRSRREWRSRRRHRRTPPNTSGSSTARPTSGRRRLI